MTPPESKSPNYKVVARRFRPRAFGEVVGQAAVLRSLRSALESERVPHALLFSGSRGVGKTTLARIFARALNCEVGVSADPCGECHPCKSILDGSNPDVVEIDAASHNLVDDIRELRDRVAFASMGSRYKVYILDEVHMLTRSAFNAFLKTLEEPPRNVVFVLATTEQHKVPETIRSRCQVHLFQRIGDGDIVTRLAAICGHEKVDIEDGVLREIAATSRGGMRDAETALERLLPVAAEAGGKLDVETYRRLVHRVGLDRVVELVRALSQGEAAAGLHFSAAVAEAGVDEFEALGEVVDALRATLLLEVDGPESGLVVHSGAVREQLAALAPELGRDRLDAMIQAGLDGRERMRRLDDRRLVLELALLRMAEAGRVLTLQQLLEQVQAGGGAIPGGASAAPAPTGGAATGSGAQGRAQASVPPVSATGAPIAGAGLQAALSAAIAERKPMLQATVDACAFDGPDAEGVVTARLRTPRRMHMDRLRAPEVRTLLQDLLREISGQGVQLRVMDLDGNITATESGDASQTTGQAAAAPTKRVSTTPQPGSAADRIANKFDGKFLDPE